MGFPGGSCSKAPPLDVTGQAGSCQACPYTPNLLIHRSWEQRPFSIPSAPTLPLIPARAGNPHQDARLGSLHGTSTHSQAVPRPAGSSRHGIRCRGYPKTTTCSRSLDWDAAPRGRFGGLEGHKAAFMALLPPHTSRDFPEPSQPWLGIGAAPAPQRTRGGLRGVGVSSRPAATSGTLGAAKNSAHNGGPVWPWWH